MFIWWTKWIHKKSDVAPVMDLWHCFRFKVTDMTKGTILTQHGVMKRVFYKTTFSAAKGVCT